MGPVGPGSAPLAIYPQCPRAGGSDLYPAPIDQRPHAKDVILGWDIGPEFSRWIPPLTA